MDEYHYVYGHFDGEECVYVGHGSGDRAWRVDYPFRSPQHWSWLKVQDLSEAVVILQKDLTKVDAKEIERRIIYNDEPRFNQHGLPNYRVLGLLDEGWKQMDIATKLSMPPSTISYQKQLRENRLCR